MQKGFTLIELLIVISIIGILASIILTSINGGSLRSQDNSALQSLRSGNAAFFSCINNGGNLQAPYASDGMICDHAGEEAWQVAWPEMPKKWTITEENFSWCDPLQQENVVSCSTYLDGACGGDETSGEYCFTVAVDHKYIKCSQAQCSFVEEAL